MKKPILWFCRTSDSSSLARITDSVLPLLSKNFDITLLSNKSSLKCVKNVIIGQDTGAITYRDFIKSQNNANPNANPNDLNNVRFLNMKYILVQIVDLIYDGDYDYLFVCNGVYEIDWITKILTSSPTYLINKVGKTTKLVVWAPIDYIPSIGVIQNVIKSDIFLTMNPVMKDEINRINTTTPCKRLEWVGHGSDRIGENAPMDREKLVFELNRMRTDKLIMSKEPFSVHDTIILNANNYGPLSPELNSVVNTPGTRKRLDITVKAFLKVLETNKNVKLWIHTNLNAFFGMLAIEEILLISFVDNLILSNNAVTDKQLGMIYQMSNISIQTSYGEGWSLTNLEASLYRSLQVVPNFLATGWHYGNGRGLLIPVVRKTIKNEGNIDVTIGEVTVEDTVSKLLEALELLKDKTRLDTVLNDAYNYANGYTWESVANKLTEILDSTNSDLIAYR